MKTTLLLHIAGGVVGLLAGYLALFSAKGARVHRKSGLVFVFAMLTMGLTGAGIAAVEGVEVSVVAGLSAAYLAWTAWSSVRPPPSASRRLDLGVALVGIAVGGIGLMLGIVTLGSPGGTRDGMPAFPFFILGLPALLGGLSDLRWLRRRDVVAGASRIARHLWRMSYALLIAALSFFLGQSDEIPEALRHPALLALPILAVLFSMLYWVWRVGLRKRLPAGTGR
ncbi:MAG: hypothetical protein OES32_17380 [Acidobacteriota bacterium]|nr:hypothetical protein [Acidobacteriota bacterium]